MKRLVSLLLLVTFLTLAMSSCGENEVKIYSPIDNFGGNDYETFVADEGIPHFSFEYPSYYTVGYQSMPGIPSTDVVLSGVPMEEFYGGSVKEIGISIYYIGDGFPNAETAVKERISRLKQERNFQLKEQIRIIIAGIEGWEVVASFKERPFYPTGEYDGMPRDPEHIISRDLFFDYQGMVWQLSLYTDVDSYEQTNADFEHVLGTLRILD
jgi:hypothetical protein